MNLWLKGLVALSVLSMVANLMLGLRLMKGIEEPQQTSPQKTEQKSEWQIKTESWINELVQKESEGRADIKILDSNGRYSYSCLQFQEQTFRFYVERYNLLPGVEYAEVMNWIYDCEFQKLIALKMLEEDHNNYLHWRTSVLKRGLGLPPKRS